MHKKIINFFFNEIMHFNAFIAKYSLKKYRIILVKKLLIQKIFNYFLNKWFFMANNFL